MPPKEQRIDYFFGKESIITYCDKWIKKGHIIHQMIPKPTVGNYFFNTL